jgi:hypothetical protein
MFGYYPFVTHIFRDAELLCQANNVVPPENNQSLLAKMYNYIELIAQPDKTVPAINDSFEVTTIPILETLSSLIRQPVDHHKTTSGYLPESQFAVIRENEDPGKSWYINLYPASLIGAHAHAGRLAVNFWYNDTPVFVDSGCCSYDDTKLINWYRTSRAHNTVLIDNITDKDTSEPHLWAPKRITENKISRWEINNDYKFCRMVSPPSEPTNNDVLWMRDVILVGNEYFIVHDYFESNRKHSFESLFHLHQNQNVAEYKDHLVIQNAKHNLLFMPINTINSKHITTIKTYLSNYGNNILSSTVSVSFKGKNRVHASYLVLPIRSISEIESVQVLESTELNEYNLSVSISGRYDDSLQINNSTKKVENPIILNRLIQS